MSRPVHDEALAAAMEAVARALDVALADPKFNGGVPVMPLGDAVEVGVLAAIEVMEARMVEVERVAAGMVRVVFEQEDRISELKRRLADGGFPAE